MLVKSASANACTFLVYLEVEVSREEDAKKGGQRNSIDILGRRNKPVKRENCLPIDYFVLQIQIHFLYFWGETIFLYFKGSQTPDIPAGIN